MMTRRAQGFTLVEAAMAVLIVGIMFIAAMRTVGASRLSQFKIAQRARASQLALELMAELRATPYADLASHDGQTAPAPQDLDGDPMTGFAAPGWTYTITVADADLTDPDTTASTDTGLKRITVQVLRGHLPLASLTTLRTQGG